VAAWRRSRSSHANVNLAGGRARAPLRRRRLSPECVRVRALDALDVLLVQDQHSEKPESCHVHEKKNKF
jgi:hypothetical protein